MRNPLKSRAALRGLLVLVALADLYGWFQGLTLLVDNRYGDGAFWCVGAAVLAYAVVRDWRRWGR